MVSSASQSISESIRIIFSFFLSSARIVSMETGEGLGDGGMACMYGVLACLID